MALPPFGSSSKNGLHNRGMAMRRTILSERVGCSARSGGDQEPASVMESAFDAGQRIVQRLDGINWIQRVRWAGPRYTMRAIYGNCNLHFHPQTFG